MRSGIGESSIRLDHKLRAPRKLGVSPESETVTADPDLSAVWQLTGSLPAVYGDARRARAPRHRVRRRAAAVKERVYNGTILGVVEELVNTRHLVE